MRPTFLQHSVSFALSALLTLAMLSGIDSLTMPADTHPLWAQQTAIRA